jgi:hypothetical protein
MMIPIPRALSCSMIFWMSITAIGSMPENGSSSSMNLGSRTSARVISTRRRSPPESASPRNPALPWRPSSASSASRRSRRRPRSGSTVSRIAATFSATVSRRKIDGSCGR